MDSSAELKSLTENLRQYLEARPTLFDAFSKPGPSPSEPGDTKWLSSKVNYDDESLPTDDKKDESQDDGDLMLFTVLLCM